MSRKVGGAVTRNKVKRWLREAVRSEESQLCGVHDVVIIAHPSAAKTDLATLTGELADCFAKVGTC